jgi:thymidylate synthase (FAD)
MKVHYRPRVILVARPALVPEGVRELMAEYGHESKAAVSAAWRRGPDDESDGDGLAELMGRLCYGSFGRAQGRVGAAEYMANILAQGHGSVMEHANWSFVVTRASRGYTHQMVRHRAGFAFSQESQHFIRYTPAEGGEPGAPEAAACITGLREGSREAAVAIQACSDAVDAYARLWALVRQSFPEDAKVKKLVSGTARGLLPGAMESRLGFTANARALRHFCELRGQPDNVLDIRLVACDVACIMRSEAPAMFQDVEVGPWEDGEPFVVSSRRKV